MGIIKILIPFKGLTEGEHDFQFQVDSAFFSQFENSEIKNGQVTVIVDLIKRSTLLELDVEISGEIEIECDRCLDLFNLPISYHGKLYVKFADYETSEDDDLIILNHNEHEVNLTQFVFEYIHLSLPVKRIHPDINGKTGCNKEMMAKLNDHIIDEEIEEKTDPRWDKLKDINKNN